jgi:hypothetical protein
MAQEFTPTALPAILVQRIQTRLAGEKENQDRGGKGCGWDFGFVPVVLGLGQETQQSKDLLSVT